MKIVCPKCFATNRLPDDKVVHKATCGKCKANLLDNSPVELSPANFTKFITNNDIPVVVDFWAPWCGPCVMMAPNFKAASAKFPLKCRFAKVNTQDYPALSTPYGITGIPTMIIFKDGREIDRVSGALSTEQITGWINRYI